MLRRARGHESDEKLTQFALRLVSSGHTDTTRENDFDFLAQAAAVLEPPKPKTAEVKDKPPTKAQDTTVSATVKKEVTRRRQRKYMMESAPDSPGTARSPDPENRPGRNRFGFSPIPSSRLCPALARWLRGRS
jgi:hypothetical protein